MNMRRTQFLLPAFAIIALFVPSAQAVTIYSDDFSGAGDLNGQAPDIAPGGETWTAATGGVAWQADGTVVGNGNRNAWLPFTPVSGGVYTLSLDVNPNAGTDISDWFALGFSPTAHTTANFHNGVTAPWMLNRVRRVSNGDIQTFLGAGTSGGANHTTLPGLVNLQVVLDTQTPNWTAEWFFEGSSIRGPVSYGTNPTINYVGFGKFEDAQGFVDNFQLTGPDAALPPETQRAVDDLFNTGVDATGVALGDGVDDPHYALIAQPDPGGLTDFTVNNAWPIPPWVLNTSDSRWIGPNPVQGNGPGGAYIYRTTFTIPEFAIGDTIALSGFWGSDNGGFDILLNGASTGITNSGFGTLVPFSLTNGFVTGTNTLDFALNNAGAGPTGLRVDGLLATYHVPEPATLALLAFGALALRRRGR